MLDTDSLVQQGTPNPTRLSKPTQRLRGPAGQLLLQHFCARVASTGELYVDTIVTRSSASLFCRHNSSLYLQYYLLHLHLTPSIFFWNFGKEKVIQGLHRFVDCCVANTSVITKNDKCEIQMPLSFTVFSFKLKYLILYSFLVCCGKYRINFILFF